MKKKLLVWSLVMLVSVALFVRSQKVYDFRLKVIGLVMVYNENHYYGGQIRRLDDILPGYFDMLFSLRPLKYEYWLDEKDLDKLTKRHDISI